MVFGHCLTKPRSKLFLLAKRFYQNTVYREQFQNNDKA